MRNDEFYHGIVNGWYEGQERRLPPGKTRQDLDLEVHDMWNYFGLESCAHANGYLAERWQEDRYPVGSSSVDAAILPSASCD